MSQHLLKGKVAWLAQRFLRAAFIGRTARKTWRWLLCKMDLLRKGCFLGLLCTGVFALIMRFCEIRSSETAASRNSYMVTVRNCVFSMPWLLFALGLLRRGMLMPWCLELNGSFCFCWAHQTTQFMYFESSSFWCGHHHMSFRNPKVSQELRKASQKARWLAMICDVFAKSRS